MKTPPKDYISALRLGSYGAKTPLTSSSFSPLAPSLTICKMNDIKILSQN